MFSRDEMQRAIEDALKQMEGVALELYRRGREEAREELAEANARRGDLRTALQWANEERDRLQRERDEAIKARDQYLRERDQARLAEERARESLEELDEAIYDCLPSDDDGDAPLDCVERAADQLRALAQERDEARDALFRADQGALRVEEERDRLQRERYEARTEVERLRGVLHVMSLDEYESTTSASDKVHAHARRAREALAATTASDGPSDKAHIASLEDLFLKACIRADKHKKEGADAYRRGAEAMREACQQWCRAWENNGEAIADALADLRVEDER